jgi:outer membrane immunogenic protein
MSDRAALSSVACRSVTIGSSALISPASRPTFRGSAEATPEIAVVGPFPFFGAGEVINTQINASSYLEYFGTVRGRLGYLVTPTWLAYGTGGLVYGRVKDNTSISQSNNDCASFPGDCLVSNVFSSGSISDTRTGWTAGGGLEWMFARNWSAKVEYLYYDLGSVTSSGTLVTGAGTFGGIAGTTSTVAWQSTTKFNGNIVRLGVNYHF